MRLGGGNPPDVSAAADQNARSERPGLDQALAAVRTGDTLVVPKLDRLARSVPDARDIGDTLAKRGVSLSLGVQIYDPDDPMGKLFFNILARFAEYRTIARTTAWALNPAVECGVSDRGC